MLQSTMRMLLISIGCIMSRLLGLVIITLGSIPQDASKLANITSGEKVNNFYYYHHRVKSCFLTELLVGDKNIKDL